MQTLTGPRADLTAHYIGADEPLKSCPECGQYTNRSNLEKWQDLLEVIEAWVKYYEDESDYQGDGGLWQDSSELVIWSEKLNRLTNRLERVRDRRIAKRGRGQ